MSTSLLAYETERSAWAVRVADYLELTKPKIVALVLVTVAVSATLAAWSVPSPLLLLHMLVGTALVAASASALNQLLERESDAQMPRTADRPLPAGRLQTFQVARFAAASIIAGLVYLAVTIGLATAAWGLLTWAVYVWIYTPLKSRTSANTAVGAVAGALPVFIGYSAAGGSIDIPACTLFLIVFLWQFPHFMAISWIYRAEYADAGLKMLSVVDPSGRRVGAQAMLSALVLLPISLLPAVVDRAGMIYFAWAVALGVGQLCCAAMFLVRLDERAARLLLRASLVYLPLLLLLLMLGPLR